MRPYTLVVLAGCGTVVADRDDRRQARSAVRRASRPESEYATGSSGLFVAAIAALALLGLVADTCGAVRDRPYYCGPYQVVP
jgi:hypothetical protein